MHKWSIPLLWVIGISLAIPAGALSWQNINPVNGVGTRLCLAMGAGTNYWAKLGVVIGGYLIPFIFMVFPSIALLMQVFNCREPRLEPPHSRTAATGVALFLPSWSRGHHMKYIKWLDSLTRDALGIAWIRSGVQSSVVNFEKGE
ncbi:Histamine receptor H3 [Caligus rogercresseyi]|uniref:Histamine receptor H3 n=1 Tax=Caligus rogercresseyi TaxID=217165 RepID=A0A7T8GVC2_CALRO|nr:Histamine receptor H3 [Caligus rogercresseyi]